MGAGRDKGPSMLSPLLGAAVGRQPEPTLRLVWDRAGHGDPGLV